MKTACRIILSMLVISSLIFPSCKKEKSCEECRDVNKPPTAIAGVDQLISLPTDSISLDGSVSNDPDGTISAWLWKKISGPVVFTILHSTNSVTKIKSLAKGVYLFELQVTDNDGLSAKDTVQITVNDSAQPNRPPIANAGADQAVTLPSNTANLDGGTSSDPDNNIISYSWTKILGPASSAIINTSSIQTAVINLVQGVYLFELKVTDAGGLSAKDTMQITVQLSSPNVPNSSNVYIAGWDSNGRSIARIWNNNVIQDLSNGQNDARAYAVTVSGNDVYVSGIADDGLDAILWKNGNAQVLMNGGPIHDGMTGADAKSIIVSGSDVYVAGTIWAVVHLGGSSEAVLWKNGVTQILGQGWANSVFVSGNDVYVAGFIFNTNSIPSGAALWKNGIAEYIGPGEAKSVFVSGSDIHVAGDNDANNNGGSSSATYWKNGIAQNLGPGTANSLFVSGSDIYIAGEINGNATLWKNGQATSLGNGFANSVFVAGTDIYVAGILNGNATLWKNGIAYIIQGLSEASSVFVQ
jgi:hypothetical protein